MPPTVRSLPNTPGVYRFRDANGRTLYIGRATELRGRVSSYWSSLRDRPHLRRMVPAVSRVEAAACDSVHEAAWLERNLLEQRRPRWNRTAGGQESVVHISLDTGSAAPGLRVTYAPAGQSFGPYLGGLRVRQAVSALHRVHPLAYTGSRLSGAERDMASKRGITAADRERLASTLTAILLRDPAAVEGARADLAAVRDRAAAALAFEFAAQIHEELQALDWITSPQRATTRDPSDFTASGWSGGVLVVFTVRAGRVREWTQRPCTESRATPHLATTPPSWRDFAHRNAELAAALSRWPLRSAVA
jgi:excinuclease ABC subunit C